MTTIRAATLADAPALADLAARLFYETYVDGTPSKDMAAFLTGAYGPGQQSREIADPDVTTLLAEDEGELAGYAQVRRRALPARVAGGATVELWRLYVDQRRHGRGLGVRLLERALDAARAMSAEAIWLSVWERNPRAIAFYRRHGFDVAGEHDFMVSRARYVDLVMTRAL